MIWVDTHAHLDDRRFAHDREAVIQRAREAGVWAMITVGASWESIEAALQLAEEIEGVYATVGIHPHDASTLERDQLLRLREMALHPRVVAVGEIGLDFYRDLSPRDRQREAFELQLVLAAEVGKPVVVHDRDAHEEVLAILRNWVGGLYSSLRERPGVVHCFSGNARMAEVLLSLGFYIGVDGPVTYRNAAELAEIVASVVPPERLLLETDAPYLPPHPYRGKRNEPAYIPLIGARVAELYHMSLAELAAITTENACRLFGPLLAGE